MSKKAEILEYLLEKTAISAKAVTKAYQNRIVDTVDRIHGLPIKTRIV